MPDYDEWLCEPRGRRRKYKLLSTDGHDSRNRRLSSSTFGGSAKSGRHWTILLSVVPLFESDEESESSPNHPSPLAGAGPGGHKASFRGTKLARRARSFKDDFLGKISQMRSPGGGGGAGTGGASAGIHAGSPGAQGGGGGILRAHSPSPHNMNTTNHSKGRTPKSVADGGGMVMEHGTYPRCSKGPIEELDDLWKQTQVALKHFRDVVSKQKLEMLPGNGTIILDTVWMINLAVKSAVSVDMNNSSSVLSATSHMYQSVARLIKLCDDALIDDKSAELSKENVNEIVAQVEDAVRDLIRLAQEKFTRHQLSTKTTPRSSYSNNTSLETSAASQRNSLPDIPLTPRERQILEQTSCGGGPNNMMVRSSHSSESILRDTSSSPPPKPPLPDGAFFNMISLSEPNSCITPPPLPPKKKNYRMHQITDDGFGMDNSPIASSLERVSIRSRSPPEDSISLLSASAGSLDSMLNHSREEDEIRALMDPLYDDGGSLDNHSSDIFGANGSHISWEESSLSSHISSSNQQQILSSTTGTGLSATTAGGGTGGGDHFTLGNDYHRLSNTDSGIVSCQSYRTSSYSKRSSQQSSTSSSHHWASTGGGQQQQTKHSSNIITETSSSSSCKSESSLSMVTGQLPLSAASHNIKNVKSLAADGAITHSNASLTFEDKNTAMSMSSVTKKTTTSSSSSSSSSSSLKSTIVLGSGGKDELDFISNFVDEHLPPAIPEKTKKKPVHMAERQASPYDNVPDSNSLGGELLVACQMHQSHQSLSSSTSISSTIGQDGGKPPPLPPKKKHIMAYMEMFGNCSHANEQEFMRHSAVHMVQQQQQQVAQQQQQWVTQQPNNNIQGGLLLSQSSSTAQSSCSFSHSSYSSSTSSSMAQVVQQQKILSVPSPSSSIHSGLADQRIPSPNIGLLTTPSVIGSTNTNDIISSRPTTVVTPPALPPKQRHPRTASSNSNSSNNSKQLQSSPPATPINNTSSSEMTKPQQRPTSPQPPQSPTLPATNHANKATLPDLLEHTPASNNVSTNSVQTGTGEGLDLSRQRKKSVLLASSSLETGDGEKCPNSIVNNTNHNNNNRVSNDKEAETMEVVAQNSRDPVDLMEKLNVEEWLVMKKPDEDGPDIRGGPMDALIIQATKATKNGVFLYQEAFLTTYRTFITPYDLICKLIRRYNHFYYQPDKKPRSREAFALIVRVVSDLTASDLDEELQFKLMNFVQQLISCGELTLAKALRVKHLERHEAKLMSLRYTNIVASLSLSSRNFTLMDFKSEQIAEQMTLLDAELFMKIEIPEVLIWAQEQNEERSPNLTRFTEHFNKMSYWARTKILTAEMKDVREKYFLKFIKIMKHLRKINNFNSYLALLSALDSAPIRRLEWQKHVQEGLKEYCALIDSSSSFRAYRQALAETQPPCIPYIGLVLQDLTFVHIGNSNLLGDGTINFSKRWQQFNIVENMKKFKKGTYAFKRNERIIQFFQNFDDFIGEDAMWQLSESIKPRGGKKAS